MKPLSTLFLTIYVLTGISDVLDGAIARKYTTTSELGAKLDSIAYCRSILLDGMRDRHGFIP